MFVFRVENGGIVITGYKDHRAKEIHIPSQIDGLPVTESGEYAFLGCFALTTVEIPNEVVAIRDKAFQGCRSLTTIKFSENIETIGTSSFEGCKSLTYVNLPVKLATIGTDAFYYCESLAVIELHANVSKIGDRAFGKCESLTRIVVAPNNRRYKSVDGILYSKNGKTLVCFPANKQIKNFQVPEGVTTIGNTG